MNPNVVTAECNSSDSASSRESGAASPSTPRRLYKKHKSGDVLNRVARQLIMNAYVQMRHEPPAKPGQPGLTVEESCIKVSKLLGVGVRTVLEIRKQAKETEGQVVTPSRKRPASEGERRRKVRYGDFTLCALRSCVHRFFRRNEVPTVKKITAEFCTSTELPSLKAWTVRRLLHDIGFEHDKRERNSRLIEREDIVAWQQKYLHEIARHRQDGRKIFYLDETWVTAGHTVSRVWVDTTVASSHDAFMRAAVPTSTLTWTRKGGGGASGTEHGRLRRRALPDFQQPLRLEQGAPALAVATTQPRAKMAWQIKIRNAPTPTPWGNEYRWQAQQTFHQQSRLGCMDRQVIFLGFRLLYKRLYKPPCEERSQAWLTCFVPQPSTRTTQDHLQSPLFPDLWRRYHLTAEDGPIMRAPFKTRPIKERYCYNSAGQSHFGHQCHMKKRGNPGTPYMISYDDPHESQHQSRQNSNRKEARTAASGGTAKTRRQEDNQGNDLTTIRITSTKATMADTTTNLPRKRTRNRTYSGKSIRRSNDTYRLEDIPGHQRTQHFYTSTAPVDKLKRLNTFDVDVEETSMLAPSQKKTTDPKLAPPPAWRTVLFAGQAYLPDVY
ncbi:hypothetical protein HPB47_025167 [Ixodes persulcatus]|uniref:Uncharacterized protein n=1 Tax=Ixodes persulcatus TaxID=34615 RepID=A0AC60Q2R6_IXOPE|nr:hypothetical protein HPB47_025167 [Ixodes persulcatus]